MALVRWRVIQQIEPDWKFHVRRIEIRHVLDAMPGNVVENVICQVAVRINDGNAMPGLDVLEDQIAEQGGFARPAFPDGVKMVPAVTVRKREGQLLPPMFALAYDNVLVARHVPIEPLLRKDVLVRPVFGESIFVGDIRL